MGLSASKGSRRIGQVFLYLVIIGLYGGAFDPVHFGHLGAAEVAGRQSGLERIIFVPTGNPPHRDDACASADNRFRLLQAAVCNCDRYSVSDFEIRKPATSWTIETLEYFYRCYRRQTLCLIMGSDAFGKIDGWHLGDEILNYSHIMVISREGDSHRLSATVAEYYRRHRVAELPATLTDKGGRARGGILWVDARVPNVSSTEVRRRIRSGQGLASLLPAAVEALIRDGNMYE